jgi:hypothetical protein
MDIELFRTGKKIKFMTKPRKMFEIGRIWKNRKVLNLLVPLRLHFV